MGAPLSRSLARIAAALVLLVASALVADAAPRHGRTSLGQEPTVRLRPEPGPLRIPDSALEPLDWADLGGWASDDQASAFATFLASCRPIVRGRPGADPRPLAPALTVPCRRALSAGVLTGERARQFFEQSFRPVRITRLGDSAGFLTGYYEPVVDGSRFPTRIFTTPLYRRPPDLVAPGAPPKGSFPNRGPAMRVTATGEQVPYWDRGAIEDGVLDGRHLEICWIKNPVEAMTIQIQGSARVRLEDGTMLRVNYDAHNGYPYTAVGRILIERKIIPREEMSMDRIREWMLAHPEEAREVRRQNRSFVFFRIIGLSDDREAIGGQGIPLTAGRSIAVDKALHVYGTPFFIAADLVGADGRPAPFRRTMIAQDTGSAIVGPARADLYFGAGDVAGRIAGRVRNAGQFAILVPRELDLMAAGARMPLPRVRPPPPPPPKVAETRRQEGGRRSTRRGRR